ncbi:hypothetical protein [Peloplasma aerotolerans]|uniref:PTS EIIB type-1 domain-containing protein n=1 Tax=Peloplasma aerotolerans TaxID=3044389 RepID=A0AAW6U267_9MOLU|nr:hypothetical protein [Mariniplasma sp. M4Ah]MDI6451967.1 hypothetical protein [Mariniplasma sp. M4Ah]
MGYLLGIEPQYVIYFDVAFIFLIFLIAFIFISIKRKKRVKLKVVPLGDAYLDQLFEAVGKRKNIIEISSEHQRLKIVLSQVREVDTLKLKQLNIPAFLKGKELTLLIKNHTKEVVSYFNDKMREDK